jgi:hypothetical protein
VSSNMACFWGGAGRALLLVKGSEFADFADVPYLNTEGIVGIRVSHNLDLHIEGFGVQQR